MAEEKKGLFGSLGGKAKNAADSAKEEAAQTAKTAGLAAASAIKDALKQSGTGTSGKAGASGTAASAQSSAKAGGTTTAAASAKPTLASAKPTLASAKPNTTAATASAKPTATSTAKPVATAAAAKPTTTAATAAAKKSAFKDVPSNAYYADAVAWAVQKGITSGTGPDTFSPDNPCHRGHAATFIWRAKGSPEPKSAKSPFTDVTDGPFFKAILWATENGIIEGKTADTYAPQEQCTRGQVLTYILRTQGRPKANEAEACTWAAGKHLLEGLAGGASVQPCTRADIVTFLYRAMGK